MIKGNRFLTFLTIILLSISAAFAQAGNGMISGKVLSLDGDPLDFATVMLKGTKYTSTTNDKGLYHISAPAGQYTLVVSSVGFEKKEISVYRSTIKVYKYKRRSESCEIVEIQSCV